MPKTKMIVVRVDESLIDLLSKTATILERKESETIRILLHRACNYWIARGNITKTTTMFNTINEQQSSTAPLGTDEAEILALEQAMKFLK